MREVTLKRLLALGLLLVALSALSGCTPRPYTGKARDLHGEMGSRHDPVEAPRLEPAPAALGPEAPYLPLVRPPNVRRVWVTAHLNESGDLIAGHWAYLMLEPSSWHLKGYTGPKDLRLKLPGRAPIALPPEGQ